MEKGPEAVILAKFGTLRTRASVPDILSAQHIRAFRIIVRRKIKKRLTSAASLDCRTTCALVSLGGPLRRCPFSSKRDLKCSHPNELLIPPQVVSDKTTIPKAAQLSSCHRSSRILRDGAASSRVLQPQLRHADQSHHTRARHSKPAAAAASALASRGPATRTPSPTQRSATSSHRQARRPAAGICRRARSRGAAAASAGGLLLAICGLLSSWDDPQDLRSTQQENNPEIGFKQVQNHQKVKKLEKSSRPLP